MHDSNALDNSDEKLIDCMSTSIYRLLKTFEDRNIIEKNKKNIQLILASIFETFMDKNNRINPSEIGKVIDKIISDPENSLATFSQLQKSHMPSPLTMQLFLYESELPLIKFIAIRSLIYLYKIAFEKSLLRLAIWIARGLNRILPVSPLIQVTDKDIFKIAFYSEDREKSQVFSYNILSMAGKEFLVDDYKRVLEEADQGSLRTMVRTLQSVDLLNSDNLNKYLNHNPKNKVFLRYNVFVMTQRKGKGLLADDCKRVLEEADQERLMVLTGLQLLPGLPHQQALIKIHSKLA